MRESNPQEIEKLLKDSLKDPLKESLVCYQQIPLRWHKLETPLSDAQWSAIRNDNMKLMEVLVGAEDTGDAEQKLDKDTHKEIRRLDAKLNLMMAWLGQLIRQQQNLPQPQAVALSAQGLQFESDAPLMKNDDLLVELYLEAHYPQAFIAMAKVLDLKPLEKGYELTASFIHLSEQDQQWLHKFVFRIHRRQIALARQNIG